MEISNKILKDIEARLKKGGDNYVSPLSQFRFSQELFEEFDEDVDADIVEQERSTRETLAGMLESEDMSPQQKAMLTRYKNKIALISENEARIASMTEELNALVKNGKGKKKQIKKQKTEYQLRFFAADFLAVALVARFAALRLVDFAGTDVDPKGNNAIFIILKH